MTAITCTRCGAPLPPGAAQGSIQCPFCDATNAPPPKVVEVERIVVEHAPGGPAGIACPRCAEPLRDRAVGAVRLRACKACGGLWLDRATVDHLRHVRDREVEEVARKIVGAVAPQVDCRPRVSCPECGAAMERHAVPDTIHDVDVCPAHGSWFDYNELGMFIRVFANARAGEVTDDDLRAAGLPGGGPGGDGDGGFFTDLFGSLRRLVS